MPPRLAPLAFAMAPTGHLRSPDLVLIAAYLIAITLFGLRFRDKATSGQRSLRHYFLADNAAPWWAIALSVVSAETSTLTIISIPGIAFTGDFGFLQVVLGYLVGRLVVALLFLPRYFAGNMLTAYQLIDQRFGPVLHKTTAGLFLLTRAAAEGVRVFAVSIVVSIAIGTGDILSIGLISALTLLYTFEGGLTAVIWTDVVQMAIYVFGTVVALVSLGHHVPGGWPTILHTTSAAGKLHTFHFALNLTQSYTFWAGLLGGTFLTMASHGTDQLMVQRLLAARNLRQSQLALLSSGIVIFFQFAFFLLIGAALWVFYTSPLATNHQPQATLSSPDRLFPTFITHEMPTGIAGLLVAAILAAAMSNLSAALNSLSSTTVVDFYLRLRPDTSDRQRNLVSKASTALWALVLFAIALVALHNGGKGHVVEIGLSIASVAYGCLLGVFLLGTLTRFASQTGTTIGMITGFALNLWLWQGTFPAHFGALTIPHIAFTWYVLIGALVTFAVGALASLLLRKPPRSAQALGLATALLFCFPFPARGFCLPPAPAQTPGGQQTSTPQSTNPTERRTDPTPPNPTHLPPHPLTVPPAPTADFSQIDHLVADAIAHHQLPGAVVVIGHAGEIAFHRAYGDRKLGNEPGLDGHPTAAETMTEDTIFDMASLTKVIVTTTAIGQLYDAGKLDFDTPVEHYLPGFNPTHDPARSKVTLRLLLTHFSGEPPDVNLKDPWGLSSPDKAEGLHRALTTPLASPPGTKMVYSDINFILLGHLVEVLSGEPLNRYAEERIFAPLGMLGTRYHGFADTSGPLDTSGAAVLWKSNATITKTTEPNGQVSQTLSIGDYGSAPYTWFPLSEIPNTAPTAHDDEGTPATNPDFNHLLRSTVHDPTARRMGGVAGHAGLFSTAHDMSLFAQALLDRYAGRPSKFPLKRKTLMLMAQPQQPGHTPFQVGEHFRANAAALARGDRPATGDPSLLDPNFPAVPDQPLRGFGWDIDSGFSKPRGRLTLGSFGHTGFTGTSLWLDPGSDTFVLLLSNAVHPKVGPAISNLRGEIATAAALALGLYNTADLTISPPKPFQDPSAMDPQTQGAGADTPNAPSSLTPSSLTPQQETSPPMVPSAPTQALSVAAGSAPPDQTATPSTAVADNGQGPHSFGPCVGPAGDALCRPSASPQVLSATPGARNPTQRASGAPATQTGLDTLEAAHFAALAQLTSPNHPLRLGLLTNQTGLDVHNRRTIDILHDDLPKALPQARLTTLFSPEHGIFGAQDTEHLSSETDPSTGLHVTSLYGAHEADRRPSRAQLQDLDAVLIDLGDAGVRCYTYETVLGYFLEAAATERTQFHHDLHIVVLDRPNPLGGVQVAGPTSDPGTASYVNYQPIPFQHGLTLGELARYTVATKHLDTLLTVVPMQNWRRSLRFDATGLPWTPPSPNLRTLTANLLYPATAMLELTNLSVGRGTSLAFETFGAPPQPSNLTSQTSTSPRTGDQVIPDSQPAATDHHQQSAASWFSAESVATALNARKIPGVRFEAIQLPIPEDKNRYPGHGQTIPAVHILITDPAALNAPELGIELLSALHKLYPSAFTFEKSQRLIASRATLDAITRGDDPRTIAATWQPFLDAFRQARATALLYPK